MILCRYLPLFLPAPQGMSAAVPCFMRCCQLCQLSVHPPPPPHAYAVYALPLQNGELGDLPAMFIAVGYPSVFVVKPRRACSRDPTVHRYEGDLTCTALRVLAEVPAC